MAEKPDWLKGELEALRQLRDEVRLQLHLAAADARLSFDQLEKRWQHLEGRVKALGEASKDDLGEIREAAKHLAREIRDGYQNLKKRL
jgi:hypothetical protein